MVKMAFVLLLFWYLSILLLEFGMGMKRGRKFISSVVGFSAAGQLRENSYWLGHNCESRFSDNFGEICELLRYMILAAYAAIALFLRKMVIVIPEKWQ